MKQPGRRVPELLAPAGSPEAAIAAVQAGADAIYLGFGNHNARRGAKNFTREQVAEAVRYCHIRGVKVYQTLNTLLFDAELSQAQDDISFAAQVGMDAVLVQELGALELVRRVAPQLPVHASTQMSLMNLDGVRMAADLGCTRAVLARELSADQIAHICAHSPIEIEVFVHGAQCMCYSGQCFFSSVIGTRSGNRGMCAQPCRQSYGWGKPDKGHPLSLKDMSLVGQLKRLEEIGVACLKIEGRMKRPEYVCVVAGIYAAALREGREPTAEEQKALNDAFSREGFTDGYFSDRTGAHMFGYRSEDTPEPKALFAAARAQYGREHPRVGLRGEISVQADAPLTLSVTDGTHTALAQAPPPEAARSRAVTDEEISARVRKTGGTPYYFEQLRVCVGEGLSVSASGLNTLRRDALERLSEARAAAPAREICAFEPPHDDTGRCDAPVLTVSLRTAAQLTDDLLDAAPAVVYLPLEEALRARRALSALQGSGIEPAVMLPRVYWDRELAQVEQGLQTLRAAGVQTALVPNLGGIAAGRRANMRLRGDYGLEVANRLSAAMYRRLGLESVTLSFEQRLSRLREQEKPLPSELIVYGRAPLMITENCIYEARDGVCRKSCRLEQAITDRRRASFPVVRAFGCRNEIYNSVPLWIADRRDELNRCGAWALRLSFTMEAPEECAEILRACQRGERAPGAFTRGLYYREVT